MEYRIVKKEDGRYYPQVFSTSLEWRFSWKVKWRDLGEWVLHHLEHRYIGVDFKTHEECKAWLTEYIAKEKEYALGERVVETFTDGGQ